MAGNQSVLTEETLSERGDTSQDTSITYNNTITVPLFTSTSSSTTSLLTSSVLNWTASENSTTPCQNEYCVSQDEYVDMIWDYIYPSPFEWLLIVAYVYVFVIGLLGNLLVCYAVWRNRSMRTVTNYFIGKSIVHQAYLHRC